MKIRGYFESIHDYRHVAGNAIQNSLTDLFLSKFQ